MLASSTSRLERFYENFRDWARVWGDDYWSRLSIFLQELFLRCQRRISAERIVISLNCSFKSISHAKWKVRVFSNFRVKPCRWKTKRKGVGAFKRLFKYACKWMESCVTEPPRSSTNKVIEIKLHRKCKSFERKPQKYHNITSLGSANLQLIVVNINTIGITFLLSYTYSLIAMFSKPLKVTTREEKWEEEMRKNKFF